MGFDEYFDHTGLLINRSIPEGDSGDTSQMTGLLRFGNWLKFKSDPDMLVREKAKFDQELDILTYVEDIKDKEQNIIKTISYPGIYVRHPKISNPSWASNPRCFSRDQQRSLVVVMGSLKQKKKLWQIFWNHIKRGGFYQNDQEIDGKKKLADFASLNILGEYIRASYMAGIIPITVLWPVLLATDLFMLLEVVINFIPWYNHNCWNNPDNADDDNLIVSLLQAKKSLPTPISWLARKIYKWYRPIAGYTDETKTIPLRNNPPKGLKGPQSAMAWKHRQSTGSPPFPQLWIPILDKEL